MPLLDYEYYKEFYGVTIPINSFSRFEMRAEIILNNYTFKRLKKLSKVNDEVKLCLCEMADYLYRNEIQTSIVSESTDGYSVTYEKSKTRLEQETDIYAIVLRYLQGSPLLYRGVT